MSAKLLGELEDVLLRAKFRAYVSVEDARACVDAIAADALLVSDPREVLRVTEDPDDDYLVALAVETGADLLAPGANWAAAGESLSSAGDCA